MKSQGEVVTLQSEHLNPFPVLGIIMRFEVVTEYVIFGHGIPNLLHSGDIVSPFISILPIGITA